MTELKPCPFCGGTAIVTAVPHNYGEDLKVGWLVFCLPNGCCKTYLHRTAEEATAVWNRRAERD